MRIWLLLITTIFTFQNCNTDKTHSIKWLEGNWVQKANGIQIYEFWEKKENSYFGKSYSVNDNDTTIYETIQITYINDTLFYIPQVGNQNDGEPVRFELTVLNDSSFVSENPFHDFPQKIEYRLIKDDSLVATISGMSGDTFKKVDFFMTKVKN